MWPPEAARAMGAHKRRRLLLAGRRGWEGAPFRQHAVWGEGGTRETRGQPGPRPQGHEQPLRSTC